MSNLRIVQGQERINPAWYKKIRGALLSRLITGTENVLDVGCGDGEALITLSRQISNGIGLDSDKKAIEKAICFRDDRYPNLDFAVANLIEDLPFPNGAFETVLCLDDTILLPTVRENLEQVLKEFRRVLVPGGRLFLQCTNWNWDYNQARQGLQFFSLAEEGLRYFHVRRKANGLEVIRQFSVKEASPLYKWVEDQGWPEVGPLAITGTPDMRWLSLIREDRVNYLTAPALAKIVRAAGFERAKQIYYGMTLDVMTRARLDDEIAKCIKDLADAEADLAITVKCKTGPRMLMEASR